MLKQVLKYSFFPIILSTMVAFKIGDQVELINFLNARSSANFEKQAENQKSPKNIITQLRAGTRGEVSEIKKFKSGNFGIKMKITNGPRKGETYWVHYNVKAPRIKLYNEAQAEVKPEESNQAKTGKLTHNQSAVRDPDEAAVLEAVKLSQTVLSDKKSTEVLPTENRGPCPYDVSEVSTVSEDKYTESDVVAPYREVASTGINQSCNEANLVWTHCKSNATGKIESFTFQNKGPNNIVKTAQPHAYRDWSFEFQDQARSDLKIFVADATHEDTHTVNYSALVFLPRNVLPAIKKVNNELHVTLPTREVVRFNLETKEILGGVLSEGPQVQGSDKRTKPASIKYHGNGVLIRADKNGDLPIGDIEKTDGSLTPSTSTATISKKGHKDCKIPAKEIWFTDTSKDNSVFIKKELASDEVMDQFLKKKCGFSIY